MRSREPLVSVVTPVYNGGTYLAACIESILAQTYTHWEYVIVNNCSTDDTLDIARGYAQHDARIRIHDNTEFLGMLSNWNHAMRQISPQSQYCKIIHADDWLYPECLTQMVDVATAHPSVGIVGAYRLLGDHIGLDGLPYSRTLVPGTELGRSALHHIGRQGGLWIFGSPTSLLLRCDLIRSRHKAFYNETNLHADGEVCLDLLQESDFGFVHQVLTYTRQHDAAVTSFCDRFQSYIPGECQILIRYGPQFLDPDDYQLCLKNKIRQYYVCLGRSVFRSKGRPFWAYHQTEFQKLGLTLSWPRVMAYAGIELLDHVLNPYLTMKKVLGRRLSGPEGCE